MNIVSVENISKHYGIKPLFEGVSLGFEPNDRIGVIGANGAGKTTLLRIIAGLETPDSVRVGLAEANLTASLSQPPPINEEDTVLESIFAASGGVMKLIRDYEAACH